MNANVDRISDLASARALRRGLRRLGNVDAPGGLLGTVLNELGLAERQVRTIRAPITTHRASLRYQCLVQQVAHKCRLRLSSALGT